MTAFQVSHPRHKKILGIDSNVFPLGIVSLLTDVSSEMIFTLVPVFLSNVLGVTGAAVGLVGGLSESIDAVLRIWSGWLGDKTSKLKLLTVLGYSISTVAKPFMYLAGSTGAVLSVRFGDRIGKGVRTSSRDALIANAVPLEERGRSFGFHRAMDTFGAVIGLVVAASIIYAVQGGGLKLSLQAYHWLVLIGVIPAVLAVAVLMIFVHDEKKPPTVVSSQNKYSLNILEGFDTRFKIFLAIIAIFSLGNSSDFFIILRAQDLDVSLINVILMLVLLNTTYSFAALPMGILSDRLGRKGIIILGWFIYAFVYLGFAMASSEWQVWVLFACYGIYNGIAEGVIRAFIADLAGEGKRGTAYGLYHGIVGLTLLPASLIAGWLWDFVSTAAPFYFGGGMAISALLGMLTMVEENR